MDTTIGSPANYEIRVVGELDENWSNRLGGLVITSSILNNQQVITTLKGNLIDQAALFGVLMTLYDLRLPLLSVECRGESKQS